MRRWAAVALALAAGLGCRGEPRRVLIGVTTAGVRIGHLNELMGPAEVRPGVLVAAVAPRPVRRPIVSHATWAEELSHRPEVVAAIGPNSSRETLLDGPVYNEFGLPHLVPTATSHSLRRLGRYTFLMAPDDSAEGDFIGAFAARQLRARTAAILYVGDEYGLGLLDGADAALRSRGVRVLGKALLPQVGCPRGGAEPHRLPLRAALAGGQPDVIVLASRGAESVCVIRLARTMAPQARLILGDGAWMPVETLRGLGDAPARYLVQFWTPERPDSQSRAFVEQMRRMGPGDPDMMAALTYDAAMVIREAVRSGGPSREAVRSWLRRLGGDLPPYRGVTGLIGFAPGARHCQMMLRLEGETETIVEATDACALPLSPPPSPSPRTASR